MQIAAANIIRLCEISWQLNRTRCGRNAESVFVARQSRDWEP
jgi:hypothetical protein